MLDVNMRSSMDSLTRKKNNNLVIAIKKHNYLKSLEVVLGAYKK